MKIKELYTDKSKWTQGASVRNKNKNALTLTSIPYSYCLTGAVDHCYSLSISGNRK